MDDHDAIERSVRLAAESAMRTLREQGGPSRSSSFESNSNSYFDIGPNSPVRPNNAGVFPSQYVPEATDAFAVSGGSSVSASSSNPNNAWNLNALRNSIHSNDGHLPASLPVQPYPNQYGNVLPGNRYQEPNSQYPEQRPSNGHPHTFPSGSNGHETHLPAVNDYSPLPPPYHQLYPDPYQPVSYNAHPSSPTVANDSQFWSQPQQVSTFTSQSMVAAQTQSQQMSHGQQQSQEIGLSTASEATQNNSNQGATVPASASGPANPTILQPNNQASEAPVKYAPFCPDHGKKLGRYGDVAYWHCGCRPGLKFDEWSLT